MIGWVGWSLRRATRVACRAPLAMGGAAHARSEPVVLERTSKWNVNFGDESCTVVTAFGPEQQSFLFQMLFFAPGSGFHLEIYGKTLRPAKARQSFTTDFGPQINPVTETVIMGTLGKMGVAFTGARRLDDFPVSEGTLVYPEITEQQEREVTWLDVRAGTGKTYRLQTGPMDGVMRLVRKCQDDLVRLWGYEPDVLSSVARNAEPVTDPSTWLRSRDYPIGELEMGVSAIVQFRLDVSEDGHVTGCHMQRPLKPEIFNEVTCRRLTERARFIPALDKDGKPTKSFYVSRVRWLAP